MRGAYYSAAFILRTLIAEYWDIDPEELEIGNIIRKHISSNKYGGEIRLNDSLPNGAGFSTRIKEILEDILLAIYEPEKSKFIQLIYDKNHVKECDSSCNKCLKTYRNINYHGLLDWKLGISLLKTLVNPEYKCGINGQNSSDENLDLKGWNIESKKLRDDFCENFHLQKEDYKNNYFGFSFIKNNKKKKCIILHPFWNKESLPKNLRSCSPIDTFNLLRRPSFVYNKMLNPKKP